MRTEGTGTPIALFLMMLLLAALLPLLRLDSDADFWNASPEVALEVPVALAGGAPLSSSEDEPGGSADTREANMQHKGGRTGRSEQG